MTVQFGQYVILPNVIKLLSTTCIYFWGTVTEFRNDWFSSEWFRNLLVICCSVELLLLEKNPDYPARFNPSYRTGESGGGGGYRLLTS